MQASALDGSVKNQIIEYDFSLHGGAIGDIDLSDQFKFPANSIITSGFIYVKTAAVGATATIAFKVVGAGDIKTATAVTSYSVNAILDIVPDGAAANMVRTTAATGTGLTMTIATAALTAGKIRVSLDYVIVDS